MAVLVRYHTPNVYRAVVAWYDVAPGVAVFLAGLTAARPRGRHGGRTFALSKAQVRLAQAAMAHRDTSVSALCRELGITPVTLYRYVGPQVRDSWGRSAPAHTMVRGG